MTFSCIFPDQTPDKIESYLGNISTIEAIEFISDYNLKLCYKSTSESNFEIFSPILFKLKKDILIPVFNYLNSIPTNEYIFLDAYPLLLLTEKLLINYNESTTPLDSENYKNLMKAYWVLSNEFVNSTMPNIQNNEQFIETYIPNQLPLNDIYYPKDYRVEFIKIYNFIKFCKSDPSFSKNLLIFESYYGITANDYFKRLLKLYLLITTNENGMSPIVYIDNDDAIKNFMSILSFDINNYKSSEDFRFIREKPILKISENRYVVLFIKFFIDKLFSSFLFDFSRILSSSKESQIDGFPSLKNILGKQFTEKYLFYEIIDRCFKEQSDSMIDGESFKPEIKEGEPDYYIRIDNCVFLFECKDSILTSKAKYSRDISKIKEDINELFVETTINKKTGKKIPAQKKAVKQLLNAISTKLPIIHEKIDKTSYNTLHIYPILVYTDNNFDIDGINHLLNQRYQALKEEFTFLPRYCLKDFVMVNINTLILLEDIFKCNRVKLNTVIDDFIKFKTKNNFDEIISFNKFLYRTAVKNGYDNKKTTWFDEAVKTS